MIVNHYSGTFKGESYDSDFPPPKYFRNHALSKKFSTFISDAILKRVAMGSVRVWGKVDLDEPPYLVLPLTVEPSKPRLCLDARFLNLWMKDCPFSLDKLVDVKRYIYKDSYFTKCDDKSGYDHVHLQESSQVCSVLNGVDGGLSPQLCHLDGKSLHIFTILWDWLHPAI